MTTTRRALLGAGLAGGAAAALVACTDEEKPAAGPTSAPDFDPRDWESVRAQFLLDPDQAQFAAFVLSPHTRVLDAAIAGYRDELGLDTEAALLAGVEREDAVRAAAATYHGGVAGQYALTDSTTMGLGLMYGGLALSPGDEVLTTTHDFYSTEDSLRLLRKRTGATISQVTLYDDPATASVDEMVGRLAAGITPRTKVVALTWVHSSTGVRIPVTEICAALEALSRVPRSQYFVCVDGVHGFSAVDVDLPDLGCDFLSAGTHKWLFGPRGTGILWGRDWGPLSEIIPSFSGPGSPAGRLTPGGYHSFEHRWALADAFGFMRSIGRDRLVTRTAEQATQLKEGLAELPGIALKTPMSADVSAGIVCFAVEEPGASRRGPRAARVGHRRQPHAVRHVVRPARAEHRDQPGAGRRGHRGRQSPLRCASAVAGAVSPATVAVIAERQVCSSCPAGSSRMIAPAELEVAEALAHRLEGDHRIGQRDLAQQSRFLEPRDLAGQAVEGVPAGLQDLRSRLELGQHALEPDPEQGRVLDDHAPEDGDARVDQVRRRVVGLALLVETLGQQLVGAHAHRVDEEALPRAEQAVHRTGRRSHGLGHGPDRDAVGAVLVEHPFRRCAERFAGPVVVLTWSSHGLTE